MARGSLCPAAPDAMRRWLALLFAAGFAAAAQSAALHVGVEGGGRSYRTLGEALKDLQPGDELVIGAGVYRETLLLPQRDWGRAPTVIRGERADAAMIKGSDPVDGWEALGNRGDGLWFDWMNDNNRVHRSVVAYNSGFGIHYEASRRVPVHDNYVFANGQRGIYLPNSPDSVVARNLVANNGMEGIAVLNERAPSKPEITARAARVVGNVLAWNARAAIVLPSDTDDSASDYNVFLHEGDPPSFSLGWGSRERPVRKGLQDWKAASGQNGHSRSERFALRAELRKALDAKELAPDWSPVLSAAERLGVRADGAAAGPAQ